MGKNLCVVKAESMRNTSNSGKNYISLKSENGPLLAS